MLPSGGADDHMTKHRKRDEWIAEILDAAAAEIAENGYVNLTMDAIAARTELSKAGIYRFFSNKREVALALYARCYAQHLDFDVDEVVARGLPMSQAIFGVVFGAHEEHPREFSRVQKVWVQLAPEAMRDEAFRKARTRSLRLLLQKVGALVLRLAARDGRDVPEGFGDKLETALSLGVALIEGLVFQGSTGTSFRKQADLVRRFIDIMIAEALGEAP
jgi:AcrR family transcriptional regulator